MHLNIIGTVRNVSGKLRCDIAVPNHTDRKPHGQKAVRIPAEDLTVEEVSPASDDLSHQKTIYSRIQNLRKELLFDQTVHISRENAADHTPVDGESSRAEVKDLQQIILIGIPEENDIINPGTDQTENDQPYGNIPVGIRRLSGFLRDLCRHQNSQHHAKCDHASVQRNAKIADIKCLRNILKIDSQIRKRDIHLVHHIRHFCFLSSCTRCTSS
ncbi:unknown [Firmicutes bacterium CAG:791]|nr:unknown [Firmicutes bacterium CAG:791]